MLMMSNPGFGMGRSVGQLVKTAVISKGAEMLVDKFLEKHGDNPMEVLALVTKENVGRLEVIAGISAFASGQTDGWASVGTEVVSEATALASGLMRSFIKMEERNKQLTSEKKEETED